MFSLVFTKHSQSLKSQSPAFKEELFLHKPLHSSKTQPSISVLRVELLESTETESDLIVVFQRPQGTPPI